MLWYHNTVGACDQSWTSECPPISPLTGPPAETDALPTIDLLARPTSARPTTAA